MLVAEHLQLAFIAAMTWARVSAQATVEPSMRWMIEDSGVSPTLATFSTLAMPAAVKPTGTPPMLMMKAAGMDHFPFHALESKSSRQRYAASRVSVLASTVENSDDAIVTKTLDGIITSWNKGAEHVFGYAAEEAIGQPITIVIPKDRQNEEREILTHIRRGEGIVHFETVRQQKHGSLIAVSITVSPVKNAEGKIIGASKIARDITEQKRNQEQLVTLAHEAEHRSKNLLAIVQAAVHLSQSDTPQGLKSAIEGRIQALANVHSLFAQSRWIGAELSTIATQELAPYLQGSVSRAKWKARKCYLSPALHRQLLSFCTSWRPMPPNTGHCLVSRVGLRSIGPKQPTDCFKRCTEPKRGDPP